MRISVMPRLYPRGDIRCRHRLGDKETLGYIASPAAYKIPICAIFNAFSSYFHSELSAQIETGIKHCPQFFVIVSTMHEALIDL